MQLGTSFFKLVVCCPNCGDVGSLRIPELVGLGEEDISALSSSASGHAVEDKNSAMERDDSGSEEGRHVLLVQSDVGKQQGWPVCKYAKWWSTCQLS